MREQPGFIQPKRAIETSAVLATARAQVHELAQRASEAVQVSAQALLALQNPAGYWHGILTSDTTLESDYALALPAER